MSKPSPALAAAAAASSAGDHLSGIDIGKIMSSKGPIVKCVLLRAAPSCDKGDGSNDTDSVAKEEKGEAAIAKDVGSMSNKEIKLELTSYGVDASNFVEKGELVKALEEAREANLKQAPPSAANDDAKIAPQDGDQDNATTKEVPLQHLIEEIEVDTTPRKSMVSKILGGDFTFLGQYEEEGTMIMIRRPDWELDDGSLDEKDVPPIKRSESTSCCCGWPRRRRSAAENGTKMEAVEAKAAIHVPTNAEFFLDYTREEYFWMRMLQAPAKLEKRKRRSHSTCRKVHFSRIDIVEKGELVKALEEAREASLKKAPFEANDDAKIATQHDCFCCGRNFLWPLFDLEHWIMSFFMPDLAGLFLMLLAGLFLATTVKLTLRFLNRAGERIAFERRRSSLLSDLSSLYLFVLLVS